MRPTFQWPSMRRAGVLFGGWSEQLGVYWMASSQICAEASTSIKEGKADVTFPGEASVFYNPVQEFNRDLSVAVARKLVKEREKLHAEEVGKNYGSDSPPRKKSKKEEYLGKKLRILEALAATGLRAIRYAKEVPGVGSVLANDFSETAVECMTKNVAANNVPHIVTPNFQDAVMVMHENKKMDRRFHVVDLDPYGSPSHFLDAAVQCVDDGGILMVTCTDVAVLCGNAPETCYAKYGAMSLKVKCCHEMALRILLQCMESQANRYSRYIEPLVSVSVDFYVRVFVRLRTGQVKVKDSVCKLAYVYQCVGCDSLTLQPLARKIQNGSSVKYVQAQAPITDKLCQHCHSKQHIGGPIWAKRIHDYEFVKELLEEIKGYSDSDRLETQSRITGMLSVILEELPDVPLFSVFVNCCKIVRCPMPKQTIVNSAFLNAGYKVSISHCSAKSLKTDAPMDVFWDVVRGLAKKNGVSAEKLPENSPGRRILEQPPKLEPDFTIHQEAIPQTKLDGVLRFQVNRGKNWGPKGRAKGSVKSVLAGTYSETSDVAQAQSN